MSERVIFFKVTQDEECTSTHGTRKSLDPGVLELLLTLEYCCPTESLLTVLNLMKEKSMKGEKEEIKEVRHFSKDYWQDVTAEGYLEKEKSELF